MASTYAWRNKWGKKSVTHTIAEEEDGTIVFTCGRSYEPEDEHERVEEGRTPCTRCEGTGHRKTRKVVSGTFPSAFAAAKAYAGSTPPDVPWMEYIERLLEEGVLEPVEHPRGWAPTEWRLVGG